MALKGKRRLFVDEYLKNGLNGKKAAEKAGYASKSAHVEAHRLLQEPEIKEEIENHFRESAMSRDEVLFHLRDIARGEHAQYIDVDKGWAGFNFEAAKEAGKLNLVKKVSLGQYGISVEFESRLAALTLLAKHHNIDGLSPEQVELMLKLAGATKKE